MADLEECTIVLYVAACVQRGFVEEAAPFKKWKNLHTRRRTYFEIIHCPLERASPFGRARFLKIEQRNQTTIAQWRLALGVERGGVGHRRGACGMGPQRRWEGECDRGARFYAKL